MNNERQQSVGQTAEETPERWAGVGLTVGFGRTTVDTGASDKQGRNKGGDAGELGGRRTNNGGDAGASGRRWLDSGLWANNGRDTGLGRMMHLDLAVCKKKTSQ